MTKGTNFDIAISKEAAMDMIRPAYYMESGNSCLKDEIGIQIMCKEYGDDDDWVGIEHDDYLNMVDDPQYKTFEIWL